MNLEGLSGSGNIEETRFLRDVVEERSDFWEGLDLVIGLGLSEEAEILKVNTEGKYSPEQYREGIKVGFEHIGYLVSKIEPDEKNPSTYYFKLEKIGENQNA